MVCQLHRKLSNCSVHIANFDDVCNKCVMCLCDGMECCDTKCHQRIHFKQNPGHQHASNNDLDSLMRPNTCLLATLAYLPMFCNITGHLPSLFALYIRLSHTAVSQFCMQDQRVLCLESTASTYIPGILPNMCLLKLSSFIAIIFNIIITHKAFALTSCPGPTQQAHSESLHTDQAFSSAQRNTE